MYFKILEKNLACDGYSYHKEMNMNPDPIPDCDDELFFTDEKHILKFCNCGDKIVEVTIPEGEDIIQVDNGKFKAHRVILGEMKDLWTIETFKWLLECSADVHVNNDFVFYYSVVIGKLEVVNI